MRDDIDNLAAHVLKGAAAQSPIPPFTDTRPSFGLREAYQVSARVTERRIALGERPVGWKIGFTNTTIWDEYGVHAPIWGPMFDTTVQEVEPGAAPACSLAGLLEPRIEPEVVFRLATPPSPDMDERGILGCIDAVAHGFEIVQSLFPEWRFKAADTIAAFALHGRLRYGPLTPTASLPTDDWLASLSAFRITLFHDGKRMDTGHATNVLGGPLSALRHLVSGMAEYPTGLMLRPGDLVTTGTVTRAFPIWPGETWSTEVEGLATPGMKLRFTE